MNRPELTEMSIHGLPSKRSQLAHAYLLEGKDQVLMTQQVLQVAKSVLCLDANDKVNQACQQCKSCLLFDAKNHPDFISVGEEKSSIGIDEIRAISEFLFKTPQISQTQFVYLNNAEQMTENARNALLKTLEEPTANSYLFLQVMDKGPLGATILSRCQFLSAASKSKQELTEAFPQVANYIIGFASGAESKLHQWQESDRIEQFDTIYQCFLSWLKGMHSYQVLMSLVANDDELLAFLSYLLERRNRQLLLKQTTADKAAEALVVRQTFNFAQREVKGQNKTLALSAYLQKLETLIR